MTKDISISELAQQASDAVTKAKDQIIEKLKTLPKEKSIKILSVTPRCFVVNTSDLLANNLSPFTYDLQSQADKLIAFVRKAPSLDTVQNAFSLIAEKGHASAVGDEKYHPVLMAALKEML